MSLEHPSSEAVGFIGLGRMGEPMARNVLAAGCEVVVYDIDGGRRDLLVAAGASAGASPAEVARRTGLCFTMLMSDAILREVVLGADGVLAGARSPHVLCDLSTVSPSASQEVGTAAADAGVTYLCGKVSGSVGLARDGTLSVFVSGDPDAYAQVEPVLRAMGRRVLYVGTGVEASYLKLVHSAIVGVYSAMLGEALAFGEKGGLDLRQMVDILEGGPLASSQLTLKAPVIKERAFTDPPSDVDTAAKDLDLVLRAALEVGAPMPVTGIVRQMMAVQQAQGRGRLDIYSILETFERLAAVRADQGDPANLEVPGRLG